MTTTTPTPPHRRRFRPRYWATWVGVGFMWCLAQLPYRAQLGLGRWMGRLLRPFARERRHIADVNLRLCFPELDSRPRAALIRAHFESLGIGAFETAMSWWASAEQLRPLAHIEGLEHLHGALQRGKGVLLLSAHFTTLEIGGRLLSLTAPFHVLYREHKNPVFETVMHRARRKHFERAIPREDVRAMLHSLKANMPVWYAPDQNYGGEHSVYVPFFGVPAATITATSRLARISGAPVVPFFQRRLPGGRGYQLVLHPPLEDFPSGDRVQDAARINRLIESEIQKAPEQYLWVHRRFKTQPSGKNVLYRR
ncbi:MAG TPA: LpxL/LpxP family Kdo(2)-lipid IV(A) lauroyl/palmitoleoyl acyltransferase [Gammaproteobacteria bacterium]|nr:LpxL/LpxP family Kdo(2)-lipid IV(A) lauroyl/palmitoleoyl acyltransferase [Gammaproteobacteria bacterium]